MEYDFERWINRAMHGHPLLASTVAEFSTWGVTIFGVLAVGVWLLSPPGDTTWKRACASGLAAAAVGLLINQAISHLWDRARPYQTHHSIVPLLSPSHDPSFPSDHATAALSIAFGIFFVCPSAGRIFLLFGGLVAVSRVLAGMHYPTDVLASLLVSIAAGYFTARIAMDRLLVPLIHLISRLTDPVLARVAYLKPVRATVLAARFRSSALTVVCAVVFARIASAERGELLDELPLLVLTGWVGVWLLGLRLTARRYWPKARPNHVHVSR